MSRRKRMGRRKNRKEQKKKEEQKRKEEQKEEQKKEKKRKSNDYWSHTIGQPNNCYIVKITWATVMFGKCTV